MRQIEPDGVTVRRIRPSEMTKSAGVGGMEGKSWAPRDVESAKDVCHFCLWSYGSNLLGNHLAYEHVLFRATGAFSLHLR